MNSSTTLCPDFLEATSKEGLRGKCVENNLKHNKQFQYFDFQKDGKKYVCWYYREMKSEILNVGKKR